MNAEQVRPIRRLEIRMAVPDIGYGPDEEICPVARLLIDGVDLLATADRWGYRPWPAELMLTDKFPLLPTVPPRRVILYGQWPDPAGLVPQVSVDGDAVVWGDFHRVTEVMSDPLDFSKVDSWSPAEVPDLAFDARQYTDEVRRATAAREWESDPWKTALLLRDLLRGDPKLPFPGDELTPGDNWTVGFAEPDREHPQQYRVTYWTEDQRGVATVRLTATPGGPEQQARTMYEYLLATPIDRWPLTRDIQTSGR
jgi:hypothetical protein